jgi:hypothetical protein
MKKILFFSIIFLLGAQPALAFKQDYLPTDPAYRYQNYFNLINIGPSWSNDLQVNKEVIVAVLDSGVDLDHPDLIDNIWINSGEIPGDNIDNDGNSYIDDVYGWNFVASNNDPEPDLQKEYVYTAVNHGTVVAGVIAATANGSGIVGIAPRAKIMSLKVMDEKGSGNTLLLSQAIDYAVENGADIINLSLVGKFYDEYLKKSIENAYNKGVLVVAASGNEENKGLDLDLDPHYPVCDIDGVNRVVGVAAVMDNKVLANFSNYGETCIDISAPGNNFYSTDYYDQTKEQFSKLYSSGWSGTSVAAPVISATAALLKMQYTDLRPFDIQTILAATAQSLQATNPLLYKDLGAGLVDVGAALNFAEKYYREYTKIILTPQAGLAPEVVVLDKKGNMESIFLAYTTNFRGGFNVAVGDVNDDGQEEIITAPLAGGGPHVRIFDVKGQLLSEFFAYGSAMTKGVNIAVGDVNNDRQAEIITVPLSGTEPLVKIFNRDGKLLEEFLAYEKSFRGGVNLAVGDVNNEEGAEIIVAPVSQHSPEIKVFSYQGLSKGDWLAYGKTMTSGVNLAVGDVNSDGWQEIITVPAKDYAPDVKLFSLKGRLKGEFLAYNKYLKTGVKLVAKDISGDRLPEIIALPSKGSAALLKVYDATGLEKDTFYLRNANDKNGYNFDILAR